jgi:hypothetical protein
VSDPSGWADRRPRPTFACDGVPCRSELVDHNHGAEGDYTATLTVTDDEGAQDQATGTVSVQASGGHQLAFSRASPDCDHEGGTADGWANTPALDASGASSPRPVVRGPAGVLPLPSNLTTPSLPNIHVCGASARVRAGRDGSSVGQPSRVEA